MTEIRVPRLNNNDETYVLVDWLFEDGQQVPDGAPVAAVETAKAVEEIAVDTGGVLRCEIKVGDECRPADVIGRLYATEEDLRSAVSAQSDAPAENGGVTVTAPAAELARAHGVSDADLRALGRPVVTAADVRSLVAGGDRRRTAVLSRNQQAVAATVTESHRTIPQAFGLMKVRAATLVAERRAARLATGATFGALELLVAVLGELAGDHPLLYAQPKDDATVYLADDVHVGVTIDSGNGLTIPVLRSVGGKSLTEIGAELDSFRQQSVTGEFRAQDLSGATISVSLANYTDMACSVPLVPPGQVAMLSLCGMQHEWHPQAGRVPYFNLGVSYDHRIVNGRTAARFLRAVKAVFENPQEVRRLRGRP